MVDKSSEMQKIDKINVLSAGVKNWSSEVTFEHASSISTELKIYQMIDNEGVRGFLENDCKIRGHYGHFHDLF